MQYPATFWNGLVEEGIAKPMKTEVFAEDV
jgi:hypothetical protein